MVISSKGRKRENQRRQKAVEIWRNPRRWYTIDQQFNNCIVKERDVGIINTIIEHWFPCRSRTRTTEAKKPQEQEIIYRMTKFGDLRGRIFHWNTVYLFSQQLYLQVNATRARNAGTNNRKMTKIGDQFLHVDAGSSTEIRLSFFAIKLISQHLNS